MRNTLKNILLSLVWLFVACKSSEKSSSDFLERDPAAFKATLTLSQNQSVFVLAKGDNAPFATETDLSCKSKNGLAGVSLQCSHGQIFADFIFHKDAKSKLIYFPRGKVEDERKFFDCTSADTSKDEVDFKCVAGNEVYPAPRNIPLVSPIRPTVAAAPVPNFHSIPLSLAGQKVLFRGMAPRNQSDYDYVKSQVESVLIFKNSVQSGKDIEEEKKLLLEVPTSVTNVGHIPFQWQNYPNFKTPCEQIVDALTFIKANPKTFFHCTVGEDRTGALAGLAVLLDSPGQDLEELFANELCEHGYSAGNPLKTYKKVVEAVDRDVTPVFLKMAYFIQRGKLTWQNLDRSVCQTEPDISREYKLETFRCGPSTLYGR